MTKMGVGITESSRCFLLVKTPLLFVEQCSLATVEITLLGVPLAQNEKSAVIIHHCAFCMFCTSC